MPYVKNTGPKRVWAYGPGAIVLCGEGSRLYAAMMANGAEIVSGPEEVKPSDADIKPKSKRSRPRKSEGPSTDSESGAGSGGLPEAGIGD